VPSVHPVCSVFFHLLPFRFSRSVFQHFLTTEQDEQEEEDEKKEKKEITTESTE
jgi:hypothetical protein